MQQIVRGTGDLFEASSGVVLAASRVPNSAEGVGEWEARATLRLGVDVHFKNNGSTGSVNQVSVWASPCSAPLVPLSPSAR